MKAIDYILLMLPVLIVSWHAGKNLGLLLLAAGVGGVMEYLGLKYGTVFGGRYEYAPELMQVNLWGVPVLVMLYWAVFIYLGYCMVNGWAAKQKKPVATWAKVLADGMAVTSIDLFLDPIEVREGSWTWLDGGGYFGTPWGNFVGWFLVTVIATGIFRWWQEVRQSRRVELEGKYAMVPVLGYAITALILAYKATNYQMHNLTVIGLALMLPWVIANIGKGQKQYV